MKEMYSAPVDSSLQRRTVVENTLFARSCGKSDFFVVSWRVLYGGEALCSTKDGIASTVWVYKEG